MKLLFVVLFAVSSAIAVSINTEDTPRDKRQVLVLVPHVPVVPVVQVVEPVPICGSPAFMCQGPCLSNAIGGIKAVKGEYPWLVQIYSGSRLLCGGSIIDNNFILTSASCVEPATPSSVSALRIRLGEFKQNTLEDGQYVERNVSVVYRHSDFVPQRKMAAVHDIAVLKLATPVPFNDYIRPICLDDGASRVDNGFTEGILAGYGALSYSNRPITDDLYKVNVRIATPQECQNIYSPFGVQLTNGQICAGTPTVPAADPCVGDNGGPLFVKVGANNYKQVGIASFGIKCQGPPSVYTRVSNYRVWIDQVRSVKPRQESEDLKYEAVVSE